MSRTDCEIGDRERAKARRRACLRGWHACGQPTPASHVLSSRADNKCGFITPAQAHAYNNGSLVLREAVSRLLRIQANYSSPQVRR